VADGLRADLLFGEYQCPRESGAVWDVGGGEREPVRVQRPRAFLEDHIATDIYVDPVADDGGIPRGLVECPIHIPHEIIAIEGEGAEVDPPIAVHPGGGGLDGDVDLDSDTAVEQLGHDGCPAGRIWIWTSFSQNS